MADLIDQREFASDDQTACLDVFVGTHGDIIINLDIDSRKRPPCVFVRCGVLEAQALVACLNLAIDGLVGEVIEGQENP